jgi:hypothetical protein
MFAPKIFKFDYNTNHYLANCDLINKCLLSSIILKPRIDKVVLNLHLNKSEENSNFFNLNEKVESFLALYLLGLRKSLLVINDDLRIPVNFFKLKMLISEKSEINLFLSNCFYENNNEISTEKSSKEISKINSILIADKLSTLLTTKINLGSFFEVNNFLDENYLEPKLKKLELKAEFSFKGCESEYSIRNLLKNVPLFWISC